MGPDFNDDGRVDGCDMDYLDDPVPGNASSGWGGCFKLGCLVLVCIIALSCIFSACTTILNNG